MPAPSDGIDHAVAGTRSYTRRVPKVRALFLNEGPLGAGVMGHPRFASVTSRALQAHADLEARFVQLPAMGRAGWWLAADVPGLARLDLDLQPVRWHAVQAAKTRRLLQHELRRWKPDVVHLHSHSIGLLATDIARHVPMVVSVDVAIWPWEEMETWRPVRRHSRAMLWPSLSLERRLFESASLVQAWSPWAGAGVRTVAPRAEVMELHPGLETELFLPAPRALRRTLRVLFVGGRFGPKGGFDLLTALEPRLGRDVELDLVTAADVPARAGVRVHRLTSGSPELIDLLQQADVFCLPSHADALPWAVLEAMACGTPVVASAVGGLADLVGGDAGELVPPGDIPALREALARMLDDPAARQAAGMAARARVEEQFDSRRQAAALAERLLGLVPGPTKPPAQAPLR